MINSLISTFKKHFPKADEPLVVRSPGRVNIIGEHTDYNNGFVLPAAIDKAVYVAISNRNDNEIHLYAKGFKQEHKSTLSTLAPDHKGWPNYILGVVNQFTERGKKMGGFNLVVDGDVPAGSGLSSSAAVECATAFALNELFALETSRIDLVKIAQKAEHTFAGTMCGIMDQFASMFGKENHVIKLDCRSMEYEYVPFNLDGYKILLLNTNVKHSLSSSAYNTRVKECAQGVEWVKEHHAEVESLRDVSMEMLSEFVLPKDKLIYKRCKYVVEESERLLASCEHLKNGDIKALGSCMFKTHEGLSAEYEVSCKELDFLVDAVKNNPNVLGSRMMGGGFGGCTINIVKEEAVDPLIATISENYKKAMKLDLTAHIAVIEEGTQIISNNTHV